MDPKDIAKYRGQVVELRFTNGARVRAHVLSVDVGVTDNHLFYDYLETLDPGVPPLPHAGPGCACSAADVASLVPTDGKKYVKAPGSRLFAKPWWKFW